MSGEGHIILHIVRVQRVYITWSVSETYITIQYIIFKLLIDLYE